MSRIVNVKVMRRGLGGFPKVDIVSHSALLVETASGSRHIIELLEDGMIKVTDEVAGTHFYDSSKWSVQKVGATPTKSVTPHQLAQAMQAKVNEGGKYDILKNNCHMAQEYGRRDVLGVEVTEPYEERLVSISKTLTAIGIPG